MKIGYARVSTVEQSLNRQIDALENYGCERIFQEKITGTKKERPELGKLLDIARSGDIIVITELTRLSRSTKDLISISEKLKERNIELISIKENINTTTSTGKLMFGMLSVMAEFERDIIAERTKEGLKAARARGKSGGRPRVMDQAKITMAKALHKDINNSIKDICKILSVSKPTLYRYLDLKEERDNKTENNN